MERHPRKRLLGRTFAASDSERFHLVRIPFIYNEVLCQIFTTAIYFQSPHWFFVKHLHKSRFPQIDEHFLWPCCFKHLDSQTYPSSNF